MTANFALLSKLFPGLAEELEKQDGVAQDAEDLRVEAAPSGQTSLLLGGRHVHSPRDPLREAQRLTESLRSNTAENDAGAKGPVVILGFGLGYSAEAAAEAAPGRPLIIVEKRRAVLRIALETRDLTKLLSQNKLVFVLGLSGDPAGAIQSALELFSVAGETPAPPPIIRNRTLIAADEEWYGSVEQGIKNFSSRDEVNTATLRRFGKRWVRNLGRNMDSIRDLPGIARLEGVLAPAGIPVFLAAAGPSLDEATPLLKELQQRCVIVAVDTSLRFLLRRGLDPDFVVVVDPQYWNARHLDRCKASHTWLIAETAVYPPVLRHGFRGSFLCRSLFPLGRFIEDRVDPKGALGAGGSVATTAWDFARILGTPSIWIAGLDLSFPGLKTHVRDALFETRSHAESNRRIPVETWSVRALRDGQPFLAPAAGGGQVLTDRRLSLYATWFANRFREFPAVKSYRLSSAGSQGCPGIAIPGLESVSTEALLALPERRAEIDALLEGLYANIEEQFHHSDAAAERERRYQAARTQLLSGLARIKEEAAGAAALASAGLRHYHGGGKAAEEAKILRKLDAAMEAIKNSEVKEVAGFLFPPPETLGIDPQAGGSPFTKYLELSAKMYHALAEAAEYQLTVLK
jgi:hypothetical protein